MKYTTPFVYIEYADIGHPNHIIDGQKYIGEGRYKDFYFFTTEDAVTGKPNVGLIPPSPYSGDTPLPEDVISLVVEITKEVVFWKCTNQKKKEEA